MPSSFHGISMASNALRAFQRSLEVTGNNIANVNTPGYSRQRVNFQQQAPVDFWMMGVHRLGQGVTIGSIDRARDLFVDRNASRNFSEQGSLGAAKAAFDQIDRIYGEPSDSGISAALGRLFDSFSNLGSDPANQGYRLEVRRAGMALADRISSAGEDLNRLGAELRTEASGDFAEINRLGEEIGRLNREVVAAQALGGPPADLLDQRQAALDSLSKLIRIEAVQQPSGSVTVNAAGQILADQTGSVPLSSVFDPGSPAFEAARLTDLRGGSLMGRIQGAVEAERNLSDLDRLADGLRAGLNSLHRTGIGADGSTGIDFFDASGSGSRALRLSAEVSASAQAIAAGTTGNAGDGGLAQALAALRDAASISGQTFAGYYDSLVQSNADAAHLFGQELDVATAVGAQIAEQRASVSGVNLDEEFADMVKMQRSYQAAARALSVFDQVTEELLGIIR